MEIVAIMWAVGFRRLWSSEGREGFLMWGTLYSTGISTRTLARIQKRKSSDLLNGVGWGEGIGRGVAQGYTG